MISVIDAQASVPSVNRNLDRHARYLLGVSRAALGARDDEGRLLAGNGRNDRELRSSAQEQP